MPSRPGTPIRRGISRRKRVEYERITLYVPTGIQLLPWRLFNQGSSSVLQKWTPSTSISPIVGAIEETLERTISKGADIYFPQRKKSERGIRKKTMLHMRLSTRTLNGTPLTSEN